MFTSKYLTFYNILNVFLYFKLILLIRQVSHLKSNEFI